ncbi:MAG TPA: MBL fold metallo-hydrolase [Streptosporangiaceae bacterium]|nr:MBL fold metallo-hydrolase [Streptosporangiaceae bacterium]
MRVTGTAQRDAWLAHAFPPAEQVRPDLWSVPVPIPDSPLRYTLTYLVAAGSGLVVVDPGWDTEAGWQALAGGLRLAGAAPSDVTGIVVTHVHPDHHGLSARLRDASGAWVAMHPAERDSLTAFHRRRGDFRRDDLAWLRGCGVPDDVADGLAVSGEVMASVLAMARPDVLLGHGDLVPLPGRRLRAVWTPGHTPGHLCLHEEPADLLLTGDHVLPRISPNIGLQPHTAEPPLAAYLRSLELVAGYDSAEALPAHEYRFRGLAGRVRMLLAHHERRCEEVAAILARTGPATVWQVTQEMTWSRGWAAVTGFMRRAAIAEAGAHLRHLADAGRIGVTAPAAGEPERYTAKPWP